MNFPVTTHVAFSAVLVAAWANVAAAEAEYLRDIKPVLRERCYACHGVLKQEAGLRLDTGALARQGSESGSIISPDDPNASVLMERVASKDDDVRMPPIGKPLSAEEIELFRQWIADGARSPEDEQPEVDPADHWAFQIPLRPELPRISDPDWPSNPIDVFLHASYDRHGLQPALTAAPTQLLRRLFLDLIGIPPTPEQLQDFLDDPSEDAYLSVVNRLLDSPLYGERWGRHWMDIWRYSDWYGRRQQNDVRNSAPQIWRWRDWIVDSLNHDKSYARMIQEMLAADELAADDDSAWPATGYLIRSYYSLNPNEWMRHNVEYTAKAFLGLTFNCAHCHDHKYDPIEHDDYFRMRAFFEPIGIRQDRVLGEPEPPPFEQYKYGGSRKVVQLGMVRIFDENPDAPTWFYTGGDERNKVKSRGSIPPGVPSFLGVPLPEITPVDLPSAAWYPGSRPHIQQAVLDERREALRVAETALDAAKAEPVDLEPLEDQAKIARQAFDKAMAEARANGETGALSGKQSVLLDASSGGRIILQQKLPELKSVPASTVIAFRLRVLQDKHANFQLARDTTKQLTALYVGFVNGEIRAYQPGTFREFVVGRYSISDDQNDFDVRLVIQPQADQAVLTVGLHGSETDLVSGESIALNGWNAAKNPHQPMTFDCRTGTRILVDDVTVRAGKQAFSWSFEPPAFEDGEDVAGVSGWIVHDQSAAPAFSVVSMIAGYESARKSHAALRDARAALQAATRHRDAANLGVTAARLKLRSAEATIQADNAKRDKAAAALIESLSRAARDAQTAAIEADARWRILDARSQLAKAAELSDGDKSKKARIKELTQQVAKAKKDLEQATAREPATSGLSDYKRLGPTTARQSTGRRSALARWITDDRNPLTARVAINHIWMRHFHAPLVESVFDFGRNGKPPTHPQLMDWLAVEFVEHGWSMKHIHRLMVTSQAYRMSSSELSSSGLSSSGQGVVTNRKLDEDNRLLWRMNRGHMESEVVRDSILFVADKLETKQGGQPLANTKSMTTFRRSLYYEVYPEDGGSTKLGAIFDPPDPGECFRRTNTIVPQQALALSNSEIVHRSSGDVARRISARTGESRADFISAAFISVLSRPPNDLELDRCSRFMEKLHEHLPDEDKVRESLIRVLFNHNDFVTIR